MKNTKADTEAVPPNTLVWGSAQKMIPHHDWGDTLSKAGVKNHDYIPFLQLEKITLLAYKQVDLQT